MCKGSAPIIQNAVVATEPFLRFFISQICAAATEMPVGNAQSNKEPKMLMQTNPTQDSVTSEPLLIPARDADVRLDRYLAILMSAMANENAELFEQPDAAELTFESLESSVLQEYQQKDLRAAYERVIDAEVALEKALRAADAAAQEESDTARAKLQTVQDKLARIHADAQGIDAEFAPRYAELQRQEHSVTSKAAELVKKGETLCPESRAQFERDIELALNIQLGKLRNARAQLEAEHAARREPYNAQIEALQTASEDCARRLGQVEKGAAEWTGRARDLHAGSAGECIALQDALRELLARRDRFPNVIAQVEQQLGKDARMDAISKRHAPVIKRLRLEMDAPANLDAAREALARKDLVAAEKFLKGATDGGMSNERIEPLQRQIKSARRQKEIETALAKVETSAAQPGGWNRVGEVQRQYAEEWSRNHTLRRRMDHVIALAKEGVRERGQKLERAVATMLRREGTEFAAKIKADLGKLTLARRDKKGAWFLVATGVIGENGQGKMEFWTEPKYAEDQDRWNQVWREQERAREKWAMLAAEIEAEESELREAAEEAQAALEHERARIAAAKEEEESRKRVQKRARREGKFQAKRQRRNPHAVEVVEEVNSESDGVEEEAVQKEASESGPSNMWWRIYIAKCAGAEGILNRLEEQEQTLIVERLGLNLVESRPETYSVQVFEGLEGIKARLQTEGLEVIDVEEYAA